MLILLFVTRAGVLSVDVGEVGEKWKEAVLYLENVYEQLFRLTGGRIIAVEDNQRENKIVKEVQPNTNS